MGAGPDTVTVRILHSNDVYGRLFPQGEGSQARGGMAPRVRLIQEIRRSGPTLVVDAGDAIGPGTLCAWDQGETMMALMRSAGYSAMTPGNHDFAYGLEALSARQQEAGFHFLAANLTGRGQTELPVEAFTTVDAGGVRFGIVGLVSTGIATRANPKHVADVVLGTRSRPLPRRCRR